MTDVVDKTKKIVPFNFNQGLLVLRIIWGAFGFTIFMYGFLLWFSMGLSFQGSEEIVSILTRQPGLNMTGFGILALIASRFLPPWIFKLGMKKVEPGDLTEIHKNYTLAYLLGLVLLELICFFGLMLSVTEFDLNFYLILSFVALVNILIRFPRSQDLKKVLGQP